ncbi:MAG TPA: hypothetical protein VLD58_16450 [Gemmatimonadales bacterium]|nr:hypothetical protein [Gemmatimonadales bacterium]
MNRAIMGATLLVFAAVVGACSDPNALADASVTNEVDTVTLWSLSHGPLTQPTAYSINARNGVRTYEAGSAFEFVFDVTPTDAPIFIPTDLLGLLGTNAIKPGLKRPAAGATFDLMTKAPSNGYIVADTIPVVVGDLFYIRTSVSTCSILSVPLYGKMEVLAVDTAAKTVTIQVLANQNCGYRSLNIGLPKS